MHEEILEEMIARGMSAKTIVIVAKLIADAEAVEDRRSRDRERKRRVRGRPRTSQDTHGPPQHILPPPREIPRGISLYACRAISR